MKHGFLGKKFGVCAFKSRLIGRYVPNPGTGTGVEKIWSGMSLSRGGKLVRLTVAIRVVTLQG